ncbi:MBL fold metallo-hydrolase [Chloroflexota bacterium]
MRLTIHRGTHEIGGSCLELTSNSGHTRIVIDIGLPLVNADGSPFDWNPYRKFSADRLIDERILPKIKGLYEEGEASVAAVLLSHAHLDHYGLLRFVSSSIPVYMSQGTKSLAEVSNVFLDASVGLDMVRTFPMWQPFQIGEFTITPYLVDHSAPDAVAFLIEGDGQRVFYSGDFRGHGRKGILLDRITKNPPTGIDYLVMEGSMLGRSEGLYKDEEAVEQAMCDLIRRQEGPCYIFTSSQNLDRLVSIFRATKRSGKTLVIDLYTAFVLDKLSVLSPNVPQFSWEGVKVLFSHYHAGKLAEHDKKLLYKYRRAKIEFEEIRNNASDKVILAKDSRYFRIVMDKLSQDNKAEAIYSMWHGYLDRSDLKKFLQAHNIELTEIHTSGHAYISQLKQLAGSLNPRFIIPIHTFHPEKYSGMFSNVIRLKDGEIMNLDATPQDTKIICRALSIPFFEHFNSADGLYKPIIDMVRKNKDLHLEFRGNLADQNKPEIASAKEAIGIYYKGNSILSLYGNHKVEIHRAFTEGLNIPKFLKTPDNVQDYLKCVPELMYRVSSRGKTSMEIEYEQMIIRANNLEERNNSEYIILANQYSAGKDRWDLLALKWPRLSHSGNNPVGQLALIEVKYALNTDIKDADQQLKRYYDYIKQNIIPLCIEMELILKQKLTLGLIRKKPGQIAQLQKLKLIQNIDEVEMVLYLVDYNPNSIFKKTMMEKAMGLSFRNQIRIKDGGLAMWDQSSTPLVEATKLLL